MEFTPCSQPWASVRSEQVGGQYTESVRTGPSRWLASFLGFLLSCAPQSTVAPDAGGNPFDGFRLVDLSHSFGPDTVFWPTGKPFEHVETAHGPTPDGWWYSAYDLSMSEHTGTHLDAPGHFSEGGATVDELPLEGLLGPLAVIDVREACEADADYIATPDDLAVDEECHGSITSGSIVLFRTGWSARWPDRLAYLGDDTPGSADNLHFPGIAPETARTIAARGATMVGIDTASIDPGYSSDFPVHRILAEHSIAILENVTGLDGIPARGAYLIALPMKITSGSGAAVRIVAMVPTS